MARFITPSFDISNTSWHRNSEVVYARVSEYRSRVTLCPDPLSGNSDTTIHCRCLFSIASPIISSTDVSTPHDPVLMDAAVDVFHIKPYSNEKILMILLTGNINPTKLDYFETRSSRLTKYLRFLGSCFTFT